MLCGRGKKNHLTHNSDNNSGFRIRLLICYTKIVIGTLPKCVNLIGVNEPRRHQKVRSRSRRNKKPTDEYI